MQWVGIVPESGEVLTHYHHLTEQTRFNRTDTTCCQIKMGMVAYLGGDHYMFKGGPEPLEIEINEIFGSKREDRLSDPFF